MREIKKLLIDNFDLMNLQYDFMGYSFEDTSQLSYHHLIVPKNISKLIFMSKGYFYWNGVILAKDTSHSYLHLIEEYDFDLYLAITSEMIDEKAKGYLDPENLKNIDEMLTYFEVNHEGEERKGSLLIKEEYTRRLVKKY